MQIRLKMGGQNEQKLSFFSFVGYWKLINTPYNRKVRFFFAQLTALLTFEIEMSPEWLQVHFQNAILSSLLKARFQDVPRHLTVRTGFKSEVDFCDPFQHFLIKVVISRGTSSLRDIP